ncbi:MAG: hypothetical protein HY447_05930 [Candidatus Omnitrophica bacterium]|nr:hypothetical protein [Candidatus Omnitrophota bacterium]
MTSRSTQKISWSFLNPFDIRKGEGRKTLLMFLYFFLTMVVLYVLKPVRSSLFLEELGSRNLRYVYLGEGLFLLFVTWSYIQLAKLLPRKRFFIGVLLVFISNLLIFWWLLHVQVPYLSAFFYVWVAGFSITAVTQFWTLANDLFDPLEAKRLFGLIISGGSAGGILGGLLTNRAVKWLRTEDLLLISSLFLLGCIFVIMFLWKHLPATSSGSDRMQKPIETGSTRKLFMTSPYLWMLAGIVLLAKVGSTVVDNQFNAIVEDHLVGKAAKTAFFGGFSAALNAVSFLMQLYATSFSLRFLGIGISLTLLPVGLSLAALVTFLWPLLSTATFLKIFDGGMNYSIQQASKEVLYLPLSSSVRYRAKPVIDMLIFRASKSLGGLLIIILAPLLAIPNERVGALVFILLPFWVFLVWRTREAYLYLLRDHLSKGKADEEIPKPRRATEVLSFLYDEKSFGELRSFFTQQSSMTRKMAAAACLAYHRAGKDLEAARKLVNDMIRREALETIPHQGPEQNGATKEKKFLDELLLREAEREADLEKPDSLPQEDPEALLGHIQMLLESPKKDMAIKRKAALYLEQLATQEAADRLLEILSKSRDHALRFLLIRTLLQIKDRNSDIRWNRILIKKEILREAELYQGIQKLSHYYFKATKKKEKFLFLEVALHAIADESLERIFRCLGLLYPSEALRIIYERLLEHPTHDAIRSHAIELLQNLLGPEFYGIIELLSDDRAFSTVSEEEAISIVESMVQSPDRWLSLTAHFLITELGLENKWPSQGPIASARSFESLDV